MIWFALTLALALSLILVGLGRELRGLNELGRSVRVDNLERTADASLRFELEPDTAPWDRLIEERLDRPPPASFVRLCAGFGTHGPRLLQEARAEYARRAVTWEELERRIHGYMARHTNGTGG